jgi:alanine racemase
MLRTAVLRARAPGVRQVNTGMNRLSFAGDDVVRVCERLSHSPSVAALRLMTPTSRAPTTRTGSPTRSPLRGRLPGIAYPRSIANSAGVFRQRRDRQGTTCARASCALRATPFRSTAEMLGLQPVMTLRSRSSRSSRCSLMTPVGYAASYTASRPHRVGVVACGYADGLSAPRAERHAGARRRSQARLAGRVIDGPDHPST